MISFLDFQSGDIALFLPMDAQSRDVWSAFNSMKQHYYLSEQSMTVFLPRGAERDQRVFVLGRIVLMDAHQACAQYNPYKLPLGTHFHVCHVEPLSHQQNRTRAVTTADNCDGNNSNVISVAERKRHECIPRISFMQFNSGDLALFLLGNKQRNIWMAFHSNKPYHFLSDDSLSVFMSLKPDQQRVFILGRLIYIDTQIASANSNPYSLQHGTQYHICYVEPVSSNRLMQQQQQLQY
jgi:lipocalin